MKLTSVGLQHAHRLARDEPNEYTKEYGKMHTNFRTPGRLRVPSPTKINVPSGPSPSKTAVSWGVCKEDSVYNKARRKQENGGCKHGGRTQQDDDSKQ